MKKRALLIAISTSILALVLMFWTMQRGTGNKDCTYSLTDFDFHNKKEVDSPQVLMLGTSLTRLGKWDSLLQRKDIINRGISGDKLSCMYSRLEYLRNSTAKICFVEAGINDMPTGNVKALFEQYKQIVLYMKAAGKVPVINLVIYVSPKAGGKDISVNRSIDELNSLLVAFANEQQIGFIDMNKKLSDANKKELKDEYTTDGLHLTEAAYALWAEEVKLVLVINRI